MKTTFKPKGTCSAKIEFTIQDGIVMECKFTNGCTGSLEALCRLVAHKPVEEVVAMLEGIQCRNGTSCPDQLARALKEYHSI
jgi:uncharacterized protein (TIGR03905 family)